MASLNGEKVNNASIPLIDPYLAAGVDPKTHQRIDGGAGPFLKTSIKKQIRVKDEQAAINSVTWYNLPKGLNANLIERILYYRGQGAFFYMKDVDQFMFLPYALDGTIDVYGRYIDITPLPWNGTSDGDSKDKKDKEKPWIVGLKRHCIYDIQLEQMDPEDIENSCVLLHDYSQQISQTNISRQILNDPVCDLESELLPFTRTALLNSTGVMGMRVQGEDEQSNVIAASSSINRAALVGQKYIALVGAVDFQELTGGTVGKADEFLMTMQAIENYRLSLHGIDSGGVFQKKAHMLESENQMNASASSYVMQDRLAQRQHFCDIVNSIWGLGIECEVGQPGINATISDMMYDTSNGYDMSGGQTEESNDVQSD